MKNIGIIMLILVAILINSIEINAEKKKNNKIEVKVMYFHGPMRCQGCIQIENDTKNTLNTVFTNELKSGKVKLSIIDYISDTKHQYEKKYKLETQTLIIAKYVNGKQKSWKNLDKVWEYSGDYEKFSSYLTNEINNYLK